MEILQYFVFWLGISVLVVFLYLCAIVILGSLGLLIYNVSKKIISPYHRWVIRNKFKRAVKRYNDWEERRRSKG